SAKGDDKFITTDYLQQCRINYRAHAVNLPDWPARSLELNKMWLSWREKK
ncbi:hypothetical protein, partial [Klebsiella pneumoniae]